jgi:hypothetical protein
VRRFPNQFNNSIGTVKTIILSSLPIIAAGALLAADSSPKDEVTAAAKKLTQQGSYSWKSEVEFGNFTGTTDGKINKDGIVSLKTTFGDNTTEAFLKGDKGAVKTQDEDWQSVDELAAAAGTEPGPRQFTVRRLRSFKAPADDVVDTVGKTKELKKESDVYSGDLTEAGAKELLSFGGRRNPNAPEPKNAKGSVKVWTKDGVLSKYQVKVQGTVQFNGEDRDVDRTTTIEIKDVGTTKVDVPEAAKKKMP